MPLGDLFLDPRGTLEMVEGQASGLRDRLLLELQVELRGANVFQFLPIVPAPANFSGQFEQIAHNQVLASYDAGQAPQVDGFSNSSAPFTVVAMISGYTIDIPQLGWLWDRFERISRFLQVGGRSGIN